MNAVKFQIDPDTLYNRAALRDALGDEITVGAFLRELTPRKRFRGMYWGADLIEAMNRRRGRRRVVDLLNMNHGRRPPTIEDADLPDKVPLSAIMGG